MNVPPDNGVPSPLSTVPPPHAPSTIEAVAIAAANGYLRFMSITFDGEKRTGVSKRFG